MKAFESEVFIKRGPKKNKIAKLISETSLLNSFSIARVVVQFF